MCVLQEITKRYSQRKESCDWRKYVCIWASYQIYKIACCACARNAGNIFPTTDFKGNRKLAIPACITARASLAFVRAIVLLHVESLWLMWGPSTRGLRLLVSGVRVFVVVWRGEGAPRGWWSGRRHQVIAIICDGNILRPNSEDTKNQTKVFCWRLS